MNELIINNLHVNVEDKEILKGVNLVIKPNETLALLGLIIKAQATCTKFAWAKLGKVLK